MKLTAKEITKEQLTARPTVLKEFCTTTHVCIGWNDSDGNAHFLAVPARHDWLNGEGRRLQQALLRGGCDSQYVIQSGALLSLMRDAWEGTEHAWNTARIALGR